MSRKKSETQEANDEIMAQQIATDETREAQETSSVEFEATSGSVPLPNASGASETSEGAKDETATGGNDTGAIGEQQTDFSASGESGEKEKTDPDAGTKKLSLESLAALASRHRIPSWQQAALLRFMDWQDDRMVTDAEYRDALDALKKRRIGGGRR